MKKLIARLTVFAVLLVNIVWFGACDSTNVTVNATQAAEGLNLQAVGELVKQAKDAASLEQLINDPNSGVNNLDLNEDDQVDYISVREYGEGQIRGFALYVDLGNNDIQEIADIKIQQNNPQSATVQIAGNEQVYGPNHYYTSDFSLSDAIILSWLFMPHTVYVSPYHYGYYPGGYVVYHRVPMVQYRSRVQAVTKTTTIRQSSSPRISGGQSSPLSGRAATSVRAPLSRPTATQREFQVRNPSKSIGSGGFGRSSSSSSSSSSGRTSSSGGFGKSGGSSSPSRSSGGGGRSFGRR